MLLAHVAGAGLDHAQDLADALARGVAVADLLLGALFEVDDERDRQPGTVRPGEATTSLWCRQAPKDKAELKKGLTSYMRGLQKRPAKIRAFFQAPTVRYAA